MEDLLQSQIRESCRLALPEGMKDLMADISREVLRAQPQNLYQFIADYLSALLVTREHLFIASCVCDDVCRNRCCAELEDELRALSLTEEDVQGSLDIITGYFSNGEVKEGYLLQKLLRETAIDSKDLPAVQEAVRRAFLRHLLNQTAHIESSSTDSELDETALAAKHTLGIYKKVTETPDINYDCVATKIQAAYRAYNVRRKGYAHSQSHSKKKDAAEKVHFHEQHKDQKEQLVADFVEPKRCASKCSSMSLAGSFLSLPLYKPYSIGQRSDITEVDEVGEKEKEHANFDYVTNELGNPMEMQSREPECDKTKQSENIKGKKTISFHNLPHVVEVDDNEVLDEAVEADYESEEVDEDVLNEHLADVENVNGKELPIYNGKLMLETTVFNELKEEETESSESWKEDDVDEVQQDDMETNSENWDDDDTSITSTKRDNVERIYGDED